jgi:AraC-like DNA-binding protein/mannose-6-phosphate isomerase-like protein (cupin superfamily)
MPRIAVYVGYWQESAVNLKINYGFLSGDFRLHSHDDWEIHAIISGSGLFLQQGQSVPLQRGVVVFSPPSQSHALQVEDTISFFHIRLTPEEEDMDRISTLVRSQAGTGSVQLSEFQMEGLVQMRRKQDAGTPGLMLSLGLQFRSWLYEIGWTDTAPQWSDSLQNSVQYMQSHLDQKLDLDTLAAIAHMDRYHYCRRFREKKGVPPLAWFSAAKIEAACFLLSSRDLTLAEISQRFAFSDVFHFSKVFKAYVGVPPGQYRRSLVT